MNGGLRPALGSLASTVRREGEGPAPGPQKDPLIGKVLCGRFEILAPLGAGGMARVYRAVQRPLDRQVALKVLHPLFDTALDPEFEKRFLLEASMTAKLKHPNTVTVHDYGRSEEGTYFIAMELLEGETLHRVLRRGGPLPWLRAFSLGAQVARSLRQAHRLGLVHRDLKPANVMVLPDGDTVKVLDFGLVKNVGLVLPAAPGGELTAITHASRVLGSPLYMAPEQVRNKADARSDIYALGVVLFQAIAGRTPFVGEDLADILVRHLGEKPPELRELAAVPPEVNAVVMKCLEKVPGARFQSMDELLEAMRRAAEAQAGAEPLATLYESGNTALNPVSRAPSRPAPAACWHPAAPGPAPALEAGAGGDEGDDLSISISVEEPVVRRQGKPWIGGFAVGLALAALAGAIAAGAIAALHREAPKALEAPQPTPEASRAAGAAAAPAPEPVVFEITSDPAGAALSLKGRRIGKTPLALTVPREDSGPVAVDIEFSLDGYQTAVVAAQAMAGKLPVHQVLKKIPVLVLPPVPLSPWKAPAARPREPSAAPPPEPSVSPEGYKADPYE